MERPWVTPEEVKAYSDFPNVTSRDNAKLEVDISRAERYVINYTNNDFKDNEELPPDVKTAVILLSEAYAQNAVLKSSEKMSSETFDDYSYTAADNSVDIETLDLPALLDAYVIAKGTGTVTMRLSGI